eukprot:CAMPEP_0118659192 /NCGR_PEP_ID=MMETSP0785-20121206/14977_1 /TAXON_ID=91992 /ORGANISM="Bolidomonas pacifica, Strain CCMP 1866" /LENGTH=78 /DNA_ID=CAMNT_0006552273 /DNA_START=108 /DNA_END=341 /DNA_ORIENTATION=-
MSSKGVIPPTPPPRTAPIIDSELLILSQIRVSFNLILKVVTSIKADLALLGGRFDRLLEMSERARKAVKEKKKREEMK